MVERIVREFETRWYLDHQGDRKGRPTRNRGKPKKRHISKSQRKKK